MDNDELESTFVHISTATAATVRRIFARRMEMKKTGTAVETAPAKLIAADVRQTAIQGGADNNPISGGNGNAGEARGRWGGEKK